MLKAIIFIAFFVIVVYIYSFRKMKRNKEKTKSIDSVRDFHNTYDHLIVQQKKRIPKSSDDYQKYVTKYNSSEDFREKL